MVVNTKRSNKEIKKLKDSIKKIEFNLNRLKKQKLPFKGIGDGVYLRSWV
jgi:hypothetical protein